MNASRGRRSNVNENPMLRFCKAAGAGFGRNHNRNECCGLSPAPRAVPAARVRSTHTKLEALRDGKLGSNRRNAVDRSNGYATHCDGTVARWWYTMASLLVHALWKSYLVA